MPGRLHIILRTVYLDYHRLIITVHRNSRYWFLNYGKSIRSSRSHSASTVAVSNAVSSASIVDLVKMVCLQDFQETALPPSIKTYPLVAFISSASEIQFESLYLILPLGTRCSEFHSSLSPLDSALIFQEPSNDHLPGLKQTGSICL